MALINVANKSPEMKVCALRLFSLGGNIVFCSFYIALYVIIVPLIVIMVVPIESDFYFILQQNEEV